MPVVLDHDPEEAAKAREVFNGMAVIYGFFFILLSAVVSMTSEFLIFINDSAIDIDFRWHGALVFYMLVLFVGMGTAGFGAGLNDTAAKMDVSETFTLGLLIVTLTLPLFFSAMIGLLIKMPWNLIVSESIIIEVVAIGLTYIAYKKRKQKKT